MKKNKIKNVLFSLVFTMLIFNIIIGASLISKVMANQSTIVLSSDESIKLFAEVYSIIKNNYYMDINTDQLTESAIHGIISQLDPHSNYLNEDRFKSLMEDQKEEYEGLGIMIGKRDGALTVIAPLEQSPAHRLGISAGDIIIEIEGISTQDMDINDAVKMLKGKPGTSVNIKVQKQGFNEIFSYNIERAIIRVKSVPYFFLLRNNPKVGYVKVNSFAQATQRELSNAITNLIEQGAKYLMVDLRSNPGGLLDQAVGVTELFLHEDILIVYTKGRTPDANQQLFSSGNKHDFQNIPLIILVNEGSASGSEIVAGAIQDYDRGIVIGTPTFGKGLVQTLFPLRGGTTALALTTANYYTPSGRVIQKPFEKRSGFFQYQNGHPYGSGISEKNQKEDNYITTRGGRLILSEGGIQPDFEIKPERLTPIAVQLEISGLYFKYSLHFINKNPGLQKDFEVDDIIINDFIEFIKNEDDTDFFQTDKFMEDISNQKILIKREILTSAFEINDGNEFIINNDQQVLSALDYLDYASEILNIYIEYSEKSLK